MINASAPETALDRAVAMFRYREEATGRSLPHDPDWLGVMRASFRPALDGERGDTDQQQCAYQAIRLAVWESGAVQLPWTKAFLPVAALEPIPEPAPPVSIQAPVSTRRRLWESLVNWSRSLLKRISDLL